MPEPFAVFLLMNNYFHDVATAMLCACAAVLWVVGRAETPGGDRAAAEYASSMRRGVMRLAWLSAAWIAASGAIRITTVKEFEWRNFAEKGILSGLIAKYVVALVMVAAGAYALARVSRQIRTGEKG